MKKIIIPLCFTVGSIGVVSAQETQDTTSNQFRTETPSQFPAEMGQDQGRERIQPTDLPDEVKKTLEGEEYRGWLISGAFKESAQPTPGVENPQDNVNATGVAEEETYVVELKNGADTRTLRFGSNGEMLEGNDQNLLNEQNNENVPDNQINRDESLDPATPPADRSLPTDPSIPNPSAPDPNATDRPVQPGVPSPTDPTSPTDPSGTPTPQTPGTPSPAPGTPPGQPQVGEPK